METPPSFQNFRELAGVASGGRGKDRAAEKSHMSGSQGSRGIAGDLGLELS